MLLDYFLFYHLTNLNSMQSLQMGLNYVEVQLIQQKEDHRNNLYCPFYWQPYSAKPGLFYFLQGFFCRAELSFHMLTLLL